MIRLNSIRIDPDVRKQGTWVDLPGAEFAGVQVKARGFTDEYTDAKNAAMRREAAKFGDDPARIPTARVRAIVIEAMAEHCLSDVTGLASDEGQPLTLAEFVAAMREPGFEELYVAVTNAVASAGRTKAEAAKVAAGN